MNMEIFVLILRIRWRNKNQQFPKIKNTNIVALGNLLDIKNNWTLLPYIGVSVYCI